ncbi:hypothetical protein C2S51_014711 [Perilla frutescens var. frutescens]|nr:hypothetical protein C2S51_014711 [Perilla frutescens var. frutescens]
MLASQPPFSGERPIHGPKSHRRPLQPKNQSATAIINAAQPKPCPAKIPLLDTSNKENVPPSYSTPVKECCFEAEAIDPSLADELTAVREKLERLRSEEARNEKVLRERGLMLDLEMKEIINRGEMQKQLELEVDRLYRLKEIKLACMRVSRLRSLRDKEEEKKIKQDQVYIQGRESLNSEAAAAVASTNQFDF